MIDVSDNEQFANMIVPEVARAKAFSSDVIMQMETLGVSPLTMLLVCKMVSARLIKEESESLGISEDEIDGVVSRLFSIIP